MSRIATALLNVLLEHHNRICRNHTLRPPIIKQCIINYGDLCEQAGYPGLQRVIGPYLGEIADWCRENNMPPINSLAVNKETKMPGDGYDLASGCSLLNWQALAEECICYNGYPMRIE